MRYGGGDKTEQKCHKGVRKEKRMKVIFRK